MSKITGEWDPAWDRWLEEIPREPEPRMRWATNPRLFEAEVIAIAGTEIRKAINEGRLYFDPGGPMVGIEWSDTNDGFVRACFLRCGPWKWGGKLDREKVFIDGHPDHRAIELFAYDIDCGQVIPPHNIETIIAEAVRTKIDEIRPVHHIVIKRITE